MSAADPTAPLALRAAKATLLPSPLGRWGGVGLIAVGGWLGTDLLLHLGHGLGHGLVNVGLAGAGLLWLQGRIGRARPGLAPTHLQGWLGRCEDLLQQFNQLSATSSSVAMSSVATATATAAAQQQLRRQQLQHLRSTLTLANLQVAVAGINLPPSSSQPLLAQALRSRQGLSLRWGEPLSLGGGDHWRWPQGLADCDLMLYCLQLPLSAADLRWLEARPGGQPAWVLAQLPAAGGDPAQLLEQLTQQLQHHSQDQLLLWDGSAAGLEPSLAPLTEALRLKGPELRQAARLRQAQDLHQQWLVELEALRRRQWRQLQLRTQWIVAGGVMAAPGAGLDLLVLSVANGLMLKEMARLWDCPWTLEQLRAAAAELAQAALGLGVIEWSNQALLSLLRLHSGAWLVGGAVQALSAAYLTRVVGHAMADMLALSAGLSEPNLAALKAQAPQLVQRAAEAEKLDWSGFLEQAQTWLKAASAASVAGATAATAAAAAAAAAKGNTAGPAPA